MADNRQRARKVTRKAGPPEKAEERAQKPSFSNADDNHNNGGGNKSDNNAKTSDSSSNDSGSSNNSNNSGRNSGGRGGNSNNSNNGGGRGGNSNNSNNGGGRGGNNNRGGNRGGRGRGGNSNNGGGRGGNNNRGGNRGGQGGRQGGDRGRNVVKSMQGADMTQRLPEPPKAPKNGLRVVALGGISEIGRNMTVFEYQDQLIIVDCGVLFPSSGEPGVDLILPDISYLEDRMDKITALLITHGHEDHIGAIPWLLKKRPDLPIVASKFTCALIAAKCQEHRQRPKLIEVDADSKEQYGPFGVRFFAVNHSIPDCLGIVIDTPAGRVLHTGDIKLDQTPTDNRPTDLPAISRYGDEGIDLFICDSTNATTPGISGSELEIRPTLHRLINEAKQRVIVACFASNVYRVQSAVDAAVAAGRKVAFNGRSMIRNMSIAEEMGYLTAPRGTIVSMDEAAKMAPHKVVLITTGTQGEPMAALSRMARREHRQINVRDGDMIILSSSLVPGNEEAVFGVINMLSQIGAKVITGRDAKVHTSGHGYAGELLFLYNAVRPVNVMPGHGEWRHIRANKELAISTGVKPENVVLAQNGVVVDLVDGRARVVGQVPIGNLYVDGVTMGDVGEGVLEDRSQMGEGGIISVTVVIDNRTGRPLEAPRVVANGFSDDSRAMMDEVEEVVENTMLDLAGEGENDPYRMAQQVKRRVTRFVSEKWRRKPFVVPTVVPTTGEPPQEDDVSGTRPAL